VEELNLAGRWSEVDIAPAVLSILNISCNLTTEGKSLSIRESFDLRVTGAPGALELLRLPVRNGWPTAALERAAFVGSSPWQYSLPAGGRAWDVLVNGDGRMDRRLFCPHEGLE
jgi:hypothetical protein